MIIIYKSLIWINYLEEKVQAYQFALDLIVAAANPQICNLFNHENKKGLVLKLFADVKISPSQLYFIIF